jgi:pimeloyl-ACP methyl ester carboxylesterase
VQTVLVHGAMDRAANFERVRKRLDDIPVISYDRRGYAGSRPLQAQVDLSLQVSDLLDVIGSKPTVLIGHSFGGLISLAAAIEAPAQVRALGIYEAPMPWFDWWPEPLALGEADAAAEVLFRQVVGDEAWEGAPKSFRDARRAEGDAVIADYAIAVQGLGFELADVLSPVAAAHGSLTAAHFEASACQLCSSILGTELTVIHGASHGAHMTHPDEFADWIRTTVALAHDQMG